MEIIVIQEDETFLSYLSQKFWFAGPTPKRDKEVTFNSSVQYVLERADKTGIEKTKLLVVSGQKLRHPFNGSLLAELVKKLNPQAIFVIYSSTPEPSDLVDGIIWKAVGNDSVSQLMSLLTGFEEDMTPAQMRERFKIVPFVRRGRRSIS